MNPQTTLLLWLGLVSGTYAQSVQVSLEAGTYREQSTGGGQAGRYGIFVVNPVNTAYSVGALARIMTNSPFFFQTGLRHSGHEVGVQFVDQQPNLPATEDDFGVYYAGNFLYRFDVPVLAGLGADVSRDVRLEGYGGVTPTLNRYKSTGNYEGRFMWTAQLIDESLKPVSLNYLYGATVWLRRWGLTVAREGNFRSLNRNVVYQGAEYPFATGFRATRVAVSYRFGRLQ